MDKFSFVGNSEIESIEALYKQYLGDPDSVDHSWQLFFRGFDLALSHYSVSKLVTQDITDYESRMKKEFKVINLIDSYRRRGHLFTKTNPVRARRKYYPTLAISNYGLDDSDLTKVFHAGNEIGMGEATLDSIVKTLEQTYCRSIGVEFLFIQKPEIIEWLQKRMETDRNTPKNNAEIKKHIYNHLVQAVGFETFIHKRFVGQKRFSLEGGEALIPGLDAILEYGSDLGIEEFVIGMPHRGRLNVLANILQKPYHYIFKEFNATEFDSDIALGDVKYHLGFSSEIKSDNGKPIKINLLPNPSHLETVGAIAEGFSRARINTEYESSYNKLIPIIIHGDAAVAAQGIVYEVVQMSKLDGYKTGGSIHIVVNNQVGFTTNYLDARSSTYCTDIAKVTRSPVFHVNGDDVEAVIYTMQLALDYRQRYHSDVFIDLLCYRKYGHNEGDEPRFTQPLLYKAIEKHPNVRDIYAQQMLDEGVMTETEIAQVQAEFNQVLEQKYEESQLINKAHIFKFLSDEWKDIHEATDADFAHSPKTGVAKDTLLAIAQHINTLPADKKFFSKIVKLLDDRRAMLESDRLDWALGELLAYGSLLLEGHPVRVSGQDSERGTFSHRHAAYVVEDSDEKYFPLKNLSPTQAPFHIFNSLLSEYGVLGFEYGYSLATPGGITIWEAQFGDFHNVAQPIIDQYISSAEEKWGLRNGLVLLLPHGYEGQGPEHSSARMERFLILSARNNMQIVNCSTPANLFHALRRQVHRNIRVPLIVFTPKSLLRHPLVVSPIDEFVNGRFKEIYDDANVDTDKVTRLVFCTGKIYYDLVQRKEKLGFRDIALIRIEQIFPFPHAQAQQLVDKYHNAKLYLWVQEEPENMGAWRFIQNEMREINLIPITRSASGSPAIGLHHLHQVRQEEIVSKVFRKCDCELKNDYCGLQCVAGRSRNEMFKQYKYLFDGGLNGLG